MEHQIESEMAHSSRPKEGDFFYGWVVAGGAFLITAITCGAYYSFGVFFLPVMTEFGWTRSMTSGVGFVVGLTYAVTVPLMGMLADRYGFKRVTIIAIIIMGLGFLLGSQIQKLWHLYVFIGFLPGLGACAAIALPLAMVSKWFIRRQGLALGIASAGIGAGTAIVPLFVAYFISEFEWRMAFGFLGSLILLTCVPLSLIAMRDPNPADIYEHESKSMTSAGPSDPREIDPEFTLPEAVRTAPFWSLFAIFALYILCLGLTMTHLVPYAQDTGLSAMTAATLVSTLGAFSIIGRILSGVVSDKIGARPVLFVCLIIQGGMMLWLMNSSVPWMFYLFAAFFGASYGANIVQIPKLTASIFGVKSMGAIFGGLSVGDGLGYAIGPLFAGYIFDVTGSYDLSFLTVTAGMLVAVALTWMFKEKPALKKTKIGP
ncbi:MFS transporter [Thermodesulfobacteriota bacterium]